MNQRLIVEGNDGWVLSQLCESNGLPWPEGMESQKDIKKFILDSGGNSKVLEMIPAVLKESGITNIGIVVDSNGIGANARLSAILNQLKGTFSESTRESAQLNREGTVLHEENRPTVGIWIMPDNDRNGYLEHFLTDLVDDTTPLWNHVSITIKDLCERDFCRFSDAKRQKALLHTWLSWQKDPGLPFGTALKAGYLNPHKREVIDPFLNWFKGTFRLKESI